MGNKIDLTGQDIYSWHVNFEINERRCGAVVWDCTCMECGEHYNVSTTCLRSNKSHMCLKCANKKHINKFLDAAHKATRKHGLANSKLYQILYNMHLRCEKNSTKEYEIYGARGIKVCPEWSMENVQSFYDWAFANGYKEGLQIDRIDVNGNYEPSNCRWVTHKENARNTRTNRLVTVFGEKMTLAEAVERYGQVSYKVTHLRMKRGMTLEEALFTPKQKSGRKTVA